MLRLSKTETFSKGLSQNKKASTSQGWNHCGEKDSRREANNIFAASKGSQAGEWLIDSCASSHTYDLGSWTSDRLSRVWNPGKGWTRRQTNCGHSCTWKHAVKDAVQSESLKADDYVRSSLCHTACLQFILCTSWYIQRELKSSSDTQDAGYATTLDSCTEWEH